MAKTIELKRVRRLVDKANADGQFNMLEVEAMKKAFPFPEEESA